MFSIQPSVLNTGKCIAFLSPIQDGHSVVFDDLNNDLYVFGGEGYYGLYDDMWMLDLDTYSKCSHADIRYSCRVSPMRMGMGAAMDPDYGVIYAFGGQEYYTLATTTQLQDVATQTWAEPR